MTDTMIVLLVWLLGILTGILFYVIGFTAAAHSLGFSVKGALMHAESIKTYKRGACECHLCRKG